MRTSHSLKSSLRNQNKCSLMSILGGKELAILTGTTGHRRVNNNHGWHLLLPSLKAHGYGLCLARIIGPTNRAHLLSDLRTSPPLKRSQLPWTDLRSS
ncbi:hypothetical protein AVEN_185209-1 [Araneus ventricosus]|uniref:Uncharacterized protein n=1 Tax=Araneus ventricosus TaxID=182803 RepID=A0A4Y2S715_ARAVE|nr:hypothetical protein AVEN_185209-1 [Araneus ventricosus]